MTEGLLNLFGKQDNRKVPAKKYPIPARPPQYKSRPPERHPLPKRPETPAQRRKREARNKLAITVGIIGVAVIGVTGVVVGPKIADVIRQPVNPITEVKSTPDSSAVAVASATIEQGKQPNFTPLPTAVTARETSTPAKMEKPTSATVATKSTEKVVLATPTSEVINIPEPTHFNYQPVEDAFAAANQLSKGQKPMIVSFDQLTSAQIITMRNQPTKNSAGNLLGINQPPVLVQFEQHGKAPILKTSNDIFDRFFSERTDALAVTNLTYKLKDGSITLGSNATRYNGDQFYYNAKSDTLFIMTIDQSLALNNGKNDGENLLFYSVLNASRYQIKLPEVEKANVRFANNDLGAERKGFFINQSDRRTIQLDPSGSSFGFNLARNRSGSSSRVGVYPNIVDILTKGENDLLIKVFSATNIVSGSSDFSRSEFPFAMVNSGGITALLIDSLKEDSLLAPLNYEQLSKLINETGKKADKLSVITPATIKDFVRINWQTLDSQANDQPFKVKISNLQLDIAQTRIRADESVQLTARENTQDDSARQYDLQFGAQKSAKVSAWGQSVDMENIDVYGIFTIPITRTDGRKAYLLINYVPESDLANSDLVLKYAVIAEDEQTIGLFIPKFDTNFTPISVGDEGYRGNSRQYGSIPAVELSDRLRISRLQHRLSSLFANDQTAFQHQQQVRVEARQGSTKSRT